jgi:hypothetical protein
MGSVCDHGCDAPTSLLLFQRDLNHQTPPHDVIQFDVILRAVWMGVVTTDAGLADGSVSVCGLEVGLITDLDCIDGNLFWVFSSSF